MRCKICNQSNKKIFSAKLLNKYEIEYFHCDNCGFLQTEEPYWLEEAYSESINISDTGYLQRNISLSKKIAILLTLFFDRNAKFLDYAGGYGVFVRLMRDIGFDFYWDDKYTENIFAKGFEYRNDNIGAITTFESFEHFVHPLEEIEKILTISKNIIFTTLMLPNPVPYPKEWWYYGLEHGQHISFYDKRTFEYIAKKYSLNYIYVDDLHILSEKNISKYMLKLSRFGFYKILTRSITSRTWSDYLAMQDLK